MTQQEMKTKFDDLYNYMSASNEPKYMMLFGEVMKEMMDWMISNKPDQAEQWIETLCSIRWDQYLSKNEATKICNSMSPKGAWSYDTWKNAMQSLGLESENKYAFNDYALWIVMNSIHSDNGTVLAELLGIAPTDVTNSDYIRTIHRMAKNMLQDADGVYNVRDYFLS